MWEWKPNLKKLVLSKSSAASPCPVYLNRQDHALKKSDRLSVQISSSAFELENLDSSNHITQIKSQFHDDGQISISPCLLELDFASSSQFYETNSSPSGTVIEDEVPNTDEEGFWKTYNLITPRGEGATTVFKDKGKEVKIEYVGEESTFKDMEMGKSYETEDEFLYVEDVDGEGVINKLRRQVEFDRKTIVKMYDEIDKERNAAAEAASQAMAMITKLQEEKALIDLDALQCQRMMEEDAKQDSIALQEAYQLLAQKEKDMQDLQLELQFYRSMYP